MVRDVKTWLEVTGLKAKENHYTVPPPLPYLVFLCSESCRGADGVNNICVRSVTVELYSAEIDHVSENKVESLISGTEYTKERIWLTEAKQYETIYDFELIEKI